MLNKTKILTLDKGLKYAPSRCLDRFETFIDIKKYVMKLSIKRWVILCKKSTTVVEGNKVVHSALSNASLFNSPGNMPSKLLVFQKLLLKDLDNFKPKSDQTTWRGIKSLCEYKYLIVHPADKGGGFTLLDKSDYIKEMENIFSCLWSVILRKL